MLSVCSMPGTVLGLGKFLIDANCQDSGTRNWDSQKFLEILKIIIYSIIFFCNTFLYIKKK